MEQDAANLIEVEVSEYIAVVSINIPAKRNALSVPARARMLAVFQELVDRKDVRAIVLTGKGGHFCAGADVGGMQNRPNTILERRSVMGIHTHPTLKLIYGGPKPVVAAVEGIAFGMGLSLAVSCDYVVAAANARFCAAQLRLGLTPDVGMMWTLPQRIGQGRARELMLMAREIDGRKALEAARELASMPPVSMALVRGAIATGCNSLEDTMKSEIHIQPVLQSTSDHGEAVKAFSEKRKPVFVGN
jgi:enoyl-CoA hydratase/carnithine racemase